jgi:hypothetical protein
LEFQLLIIVDGILAIGLSPFYCPRPGLQSTKSNASVSRKLAIAISQLRSDIQFPQHARSEPFEFVLASVSKSLRHQQEKVVFKVWLAWHSPLGWNLIDIFKPEPNSDLAI